MTNNAFALSGTEYLNKCSIEKLRSLDKPKYLSAMTFCTSIVRGVIEGHYATAGYYKNRRMFCIPKGKTYVDLTGEVVGRLGIEKEFKDQAFGGLAIIYLSRAFPCEK